MQVYEKWKKVELHSMRDIEVEMCEVNLAFVCSTRALPLIRKALRSADRRVSLCDAAMATVRTQRSDQRRSSQHADLTASRERVVLADGHEAA